MGYRTAPNGSLGPPFCRLYMDFCINSINKVSKLLVLHEPDAQRNECQKHCLLCNDCEVTSMLGIYHVLCCMLPIIYIGHRLCCDHCYTCVDLPEQYGCYDQYGTLIVNVNSCQ